ncbi:hypothetical protein [Hymenobacter sp. YC55]|uniref:hypothetical protein n=1 Tax=Hymenobacter sp. YC55 TaxID=3034019 RepID=UPI0023F89A45|nr:hypothetical protein [Hymenobacter sp. YC55]MDF7815325.1 hypothetical protein [Hymenobacter sp. YC55]
MAAGASVARVLEQELRSADSRGAQLAVPGQIGLEADARQERRAVLDAHEPAPTQEGFAWPGVACAPPRFFTLPRAHAIPRGTNSLEGNTAPDFRRYAHGGARLEFACEFKNYDGEILAFLEWIAPYVRDRFGKRSWGRRMVWVGWMRREHERHYNIFIIPGDDCRVLVW